MTANNNERRKRHGGLWWSAFILGLISAGPWTGVMVSVYEVNLFFMALVLIPWAGLALAWKWPRVGGALLIITVSLQFLPVVISAVSGFRVLEEHQGAFGGHLGPAFALAFAILFMSPLIVVSGVLFLLSWREGRKEVPKQ